MIASLSIPWGDSKGDHELGGYHLVWPRDLVNSAGALLALGHDVLARRTLRYLISTQEADGRWAQNLWLDGTPYWHGLQMDEVAFPILFAELLRREEQLADIDPWPMIRARRGIPRAQRARSRDRIAGRRTAATRRSPSRSRCRRCSSPRISPSARGEPDWRELLRDTADAWNARIERWTYVTRHAHRAGGAAWTATTCASHRRTCATTACRRAAACIPIRNRPARRDAMRATTRS